jgi:hypothetical protein
MLFLLVLKSRSMRGNVFAQRGAREDATAVRIGNVSSV